MSQRSAKQTVERILSGSEVRLNGPNRWDPQVHDERLYQRILTTNTLGLGEGYMDGWWDCGAVDELIYKLGGPDSSIRTLNKLRLVGFALRTVAFNSQTLSRARRNAQAHYDIGNDLYEAMLGPTMAYSCGYWKNAKTLDQAQEAKFDLICRKLQFTTGMKVLDVGCGWGGLMRHAVKNYGVIATGITPAREQVAYIREMAKGNRNITVLEQDYRQPLPEVYDRIVSVGMFEHVGPKNYKRFFRIMEGLLAPDGLFLLHTIAGGKGSSRFSDPWLDKYIFPGGRLPSARQMTTGFEGVFLLEDWHNFGVDYDKTLLAWHDNFQKAWPKLHAHYDERFKRMWQYYLLLCAGTFRNRRNNLWQIVLSKNGCKGGYTSVR